MNVPAALGEYLRTEASETILLVGTRSYWCLGPQNATMPYVAFRQASETRLAIHMNGADAPRETTIEIVCFASDQESAWTVAEAIRTDLDNRTGLTPSTGTVKFKHCYESNATDLVSAENLEAGAFAVALEYRIRT